MLDKVKIKGPGRPKKRKNSKNPFEIGRCKLWLKSRKGSEKLALWQDFRRLAALLDSSPTIFIGDFNEVRFQRERINYNIRLREIRVFNSWIEDSNLLEIPLENANFTWIGPNGKRSKLDRALSNSEWPNQAD
ncbi:hypothetical protein POM88_006838 [Heracleum sosnowskyi]|uniref:Endonuclease/exonuclease/phosphatase domain-containing protein n=1 Tax=Heracleum sosnowskyi TaxID=360622 RepID=A0AAD8N0D3_9APIA|nr:hypothetical protein POM88_006838 [Heracleum sosnowskyi]